jgi:hypothetical protein
LTPAAAPHCRTQSRLRVRWCGAEQLREVPQRADVRRLHRKARCCGCNGCAAAAVMVALLRLYWLCGAASLACPGVVCAQA